MAPLRAGSGLGSGFGTLPPHKPGWGSATPPPPATATLTDPKSPGQRPPPGIHKGHNGGVGAISRISEGSAGSYWGLGAHQLVAILSDEQKGRRTVSKQGAPAGRDTRDEEAITALADQTPLSLCHGCLCISVFRQIE